MALTPIDVNHALQIQAGIDGRNNGHEFEFELAESINSIIDTVKVQQITSNIILGEPSLALIHKALSFLGWEYCDEVSAIELGSLATAEEGKKLLKVDGVTIKACKSDILLTLTKDGESESIGVSVKQCKNIKPTNAQLYFTTATGFYNLLVNNGILLSDNAKVALRQFCGDVGFRPMDTPELMNTRKSHPGRFFWEEVNTAGRVELETIFHEKQDDITRLLLQKAYLNDPYIPELLIHKTKKTIGPDGEFAIYSIEELIYLSRQYSGFIKTLRTEVSKSKSYELEKGLKHECPKFGIVQMQRGGQKQHPTQLQFNLQASYFYKI